MTLLESSKSPSYSCHLSARSKTYGRRSSEVTVQLVDHDSKESMAFEMPIW